MFGAISPNFRLIDGDFLSIPAVGLEEVIQSMKALSVRFIRTINKRFDSPVREASMVKNAARTRRSIDVSSRETTSC